MEPSDYFFLFAFRRYYPTVFCVEYKTANKKLVFCGMKTNSIYSVEVKYLYIVKARSKWSVQVIEKISSRTGNWHGKVRFSSSILTIAPLFFFSGNLKVVFALFLWTTEICSRWLSLSKICCRNYYFCCDKCLCLLLCSSIFNCRPGSMVVAPSLFNVCVVDRHHKVTPGQNPNGSWQGEKMFHSFTAFWNEIL